MKYPALLLGIGLITWLIRRDVASRGYWEKALWIPFFWLLIYCTRPVAAWIGAGGGGSETEGSDIDATIVLCLIIAAFVVLCRRNIDWAYMMRANPAFTVLFAYFLLSIIWAPFPFVAMKRLFKEFGHILVVFVIITSNNPSAAFRAVIFRVACILIPLSIVLYKWFPEYGRAYSFGGLPMITGVTTQKNSLGQICAYFCLVIIWDIIESKYNSHRGINTNRQYPEKWIILLTGFWLLVASDSKTSILALAVSLIVFFSTKIPLLRSNPRFFAQSAFISVSVILIISAFYTFAIAPLLEAVGRDASFTERTRIWTEVLSQDVNSIIGSGFFSFWLSPHGVAVQDTFVNFVPRSSHNGYLEIYLDGGWVGVGLLLIFIFSICMRYARFFSPSANFAKILFSMTLMALIINFSEASFFRLAILWFCLIMAVFTPTSALTRQSSDF